jgi:integrase
MARVSRVKLLKQIKTDKGWMLATALFDSKGRVRRDHVLVAGVDEVHAEGTYFIEYWLSGKRSREAAGADAARAADLMKFRQGEVAAIRSGVVPAPVPEPEKPKRLAVDQAIDDYLEYIKYNRTLRTFRTYRPILLAYKEFNRHQYIDQIAREDLMAFATAALKQGQKGKSVYNKLVVISQLLKQHGRGKLLNATDWPSFVETVRPIYEDKELATFFKACTRDEEVRFKFYLMSGFRDAEGRFVTWRDVDARNSTVRVTAKQQWGFTPKNWEEREVPVPKALIALLQSYKPAGAKADDPVFTSSTGRPDGAMLEKCKAVAFRAGLNCGRHVLKHKLKDGSIRINRCAAGPYCQFWFLHKFRHTYATRNLQDGIDIRTLQIWMGHRDIASTMVYLKGVRNSDIQSKLDKGSLAAFA